MTHIAVAEKDRPKRHPSAEIKEREREVSMGKCDNIIKNYNEVVE